MAAPTRVDPKEYLATSFAGPDREFVHGELRERSMPTYLHGKIQALLCIRFGALIGHYPLFIVTEFRHALDPQRLYRIPDVAVFSGREPSQPIPDTPPLVAIEIASPDDRLIDTLTKFGEYRTWGVPNVWMVDPVAKQLYLYDATGLHPVAALSLPQYEFSITLADLGL
ncbi:MAG: Uma2 family endonuclease [Bryobacteraceae bacterium]|nr:Uma2 family endonuclease [Bryobacteraceae bacterium]